MKLQSTFKKLQPLAIWGIADIYFIMAVTVTILFGVLSHDMQKQLNLSSGHLGFLGFGFFLSFGVTQMLTGGLIDSRGPRFALTLLASIAAIGLFLLSAAVGFTQAFIAQIVTGAGFSISYVGAIYLASTWFSQRHFSLLSGITQMSSNIISATLITVMALIGTVNTDFRIITKGMAIAVLVMAFLLFLIIRTPPGISQKAASEKPKAAFWQDVKKLWITQYWLGAFYFISTLSVFLSFSSLWNVPESLAYGRSMQTATMLSATLRYGSAFGALLAGLITGYLGKYAKIIKYYSTGALISGALLFFGPQLPISIVFILFALFGLFLGGSAIGFPLVGQYIPQTLRGTGFGLMVALSYLLCASLQYLIGILLDDEVSAGSPLTIHAFKVALIPLIVVLAVGWLCALWLRDNKTEVNT